VTDRLSPDGDRTAADQQTVKYPRIGPGADTQTAAAGLARALDLEHRQAPLVGHGTWCDLDAEARDHLRLGLAVAAMGHTVDMAEPGPRGFQRYWRCVNCGLHAGLASEECPPTVPPGSVPVTIFHNVTGKAVPYQPGDPVLRVFTYTARVGADASRPLMRQYVTVKSAAEHALVLSVASPGTLNGDEQEFSAYYDRQVRGIQCGDLVQVGDVTLAQERSGWRIVTDPVNEITRARS
jgi:hypothetical protein